MQTHTKATLLRKHGSKEKDTKTTLHLLYVHMQQMQGSLHVFPFPSGSLLVCLLSLPCSRTFISSSLYLNNFWKILLPLVQFNFDCETPVHDNTED